MLDCDWAQSKSPDPFSLQGTDPTGGSHGHDSDHQLDDGGGPGQSAGDDDRPNACGADPLPAVKYQIVIMFLIAAGTSLGTVGVVLLGYRRLFTPDHQFLPNRLAKRG